MKQKNKFQPTILVIENNLATQKELAKKFEKAGYIVLVAANGGEGLRELHKKPDVVVIDLFLPNMNSMSFLGFKDANPQFRDIPLFFVSSIDKPEELQQAYGPSAKGYFDPSQMKSEGIVKELEEFLKQERDKK